MEGNGLDNVWLNPHWFEEMLLFLRKVMWNVFFILVVQIIFFYKKTGFEDMGWFMVFNAIYSNISVMLWRSVLLVEETGVTVENPRLTASHWHTLSHNVVSSTPRLSGVWIHNFSCDRHWLHIRNGRKGTW